MVDIANELGISKSSLWYKLKKFDLLNTDKKKHIKRSFNEKLIDENDVNVTYLIGLMAVDGFIDRGNLLTLTLSGEEGLELLNELAQKIEYTGEIKKRVNHGGFSDKPFYEFTICSEKFMKHMNNTYNIVGKKSDGLDRFPLNLTEFDEELQKSFILGIFDGDGTLDTVRGRYQITIPNENMLLNLKEFLENKFDCQLKIYYRTDRENNYPYLQIPTVISEKLSKWMYSSGCINMKYKYEKHIKTFM